MRYSLLFLAGLLCCGCSTSARARSTLSVFPPATLNASATAGYGVSTAGPMCTMRAGAMFPIGFYAGGTCSYYLTERQVLYNAVLYTVGVELMLFGVEAGHEFTLSPQARLRPYLTAGHAVLTSIRVTSPPFVGRVRVESEDGSGQGFALGVGLLGAVAVSERLDAVLDARLMFGLALSVSAGIQVRW